MTQYEVKELLQSARRCYTAYTLARDTEIAYRDQLFGRSSGSGIHTVSKEHDAAFIKLAIYSEKTDKAKAEWLKAIDTVTEIIGKADTQERRDILVYRYLNNYTFERIAAVKSCNVRNVYKVYKKSIQYLSKIL